MTMGVVPGTVPEVICGVIPKENLEAIRNATRRAMCGAYSSAMC